MTYSTNAGRMIPALVEFPIRTNFALEDDVDMVTCFLNVLYQPNLPFLANGLISGLSLMDN